MKSIARLPTTRIEIYLGLLLGKKNEEISRSYKETAVTEIVLLLRLSSIPPTDLVFSF